MSIVPAVKVLPTEDSVSVKYALVAPKPTAATKAIVITLKSIFFIFLFHLLSLETVDKTVSFVLQFLTSAETSIRERGWKPRREHKRRRTDKFSPDLFFAKGFKKSTFARNCKSASVCGQHNI